jgi:hypothetical protein
MKKIWVYLCGKITGLRLGEGCKTQLKFSLQTKWQLLPNRCYLLGGLSALYLI